jgi:predicted glycosyltransferase
VLDRLSERSDVRLVVLPRNQRQGERIRQERRMLFESDKAIIPQQVVDGLNLVWHSDLVISGGGTMNREAAALGVPVYSMFRGRIGAVDRYLVRTGRMTLLESVEDVYQKLVIRHRDHHRNRTHANGDALQTIVGHLVNIAEGTC